MKTIILFLMLTVAPYAKATVHTKQQPVSQCSEGEHAATSGRQYYCVLDKYGIGHFAEDFESEEKIRQYDLHKEQLAAALTNRVLTDAELKEVLSIGPDLFVHTGVMFSQHEINDQFLDALAIQVKLIELQAAKR